MARIRIATFFNEDLKRIIKTRSFQTAYVAMTFFDGSLKSVSSFVIMSVYVGAIVNQETNLVR